MKSLKILESSNIEKALSSIYKLSHHWLIRAPHPLASYTLGCATYLDAKNNYSEYENLIRKFNPILMENFQWLYQDIIDSLSIEYGKMVINKYLAHPGFHIFGAPLGEKVSDAACRLMEKPIASIHVDAPYRAHMHHWELYETVDFLNPLSITLCLCLPEHGGGLNTWQKLDRKTTFGGHDMLDIQFNRSILVDSKYTPYKPGFIYVSSGHRIHQIAPANPMLTTDHRITLQAHALKCDGVWQLFF